MSRRHPIQNQRLMLVTTNTKARMPFFKTPALAWEAVDCLYRIQYYNPFFLYAFVIMPDHCHFLMNIPKSGSISEVLHTYKRAVSFGVDKNIWQPRFRVVMPKRPGQALQYIHHNPVVAKLCGSPEQYTWSSASGKFDVAQLPDE